MNWPWQRANQAWPTRYSDLQDRHLDLLQRHEDLQDRYGTLQDQYLAVAAELLEFKKLGALIQAHHAALVETGARQATKASGRDENDRSG